MMEVLEFTCFFERFQKNLDIQVDSDIVGYIFDFYEDKSTYENYTLLELIGLLKTKRIQITCDLNKYAIIEMIEEQNIDILKKDSVLQPSSWSSDRRRPGMD